MNSTNLKNNWIEENSKLKLTITLKNFSECMDLANKIASIAEEMKHHPNLCIRNYKTLEIEIYTHTEKKLTEKDYQFAERVNMIL